MQVDLPRNGKLLALARKHPSDKAMADELGVARETMRDHINRLGMREQVMSVRDTAKDSGIPNEIPVIRRDYSGQDRHFIYPLGDVHIGAKTHNAPMWEEWLKFVAQRDESSLLGTGDFLNTAILGSKSDVYDERLTVGEAKRTLRDQLTPLAATGRIDGLAPGNHEDRITRAIGDCPIRDVADSLEVPYVEAACLYVYTVGEVEYEVYFRHGTGNGQSLAALSKSDKVISADVYVTGHTHRQAATADDYFVRHGNVATRRKRYFVSSGSFMGYERYAAQRGYPPSRLGAPRIYLEGNRRDIHVSL